MKTIRNLLRNSLVLAASIFVCWSCAVEDELGGNADFFAAYDFSQDQSDWQGGFAGYPVGLEDSLQLTVSMGEYPTESGQLASALILSGQNPHGQLFSFIYTTIEGLAPNTRYSVELIMQFLVEQRSVLPAAQEMVTVRMSILPYQPLATREFDDTSGLEYANVNFDVTSVAPNTASNAAVLGNIKLEADKKFSQWQASNADVPVSVQSDAQGRLWLAVGFDSKVKAHLAYYIDGVNIYLHNAD